MARTKKPDIDSALEKFRLAESYWGTLHGEMDTDYNISQNLQQINVPSGYDAYYTGTANALIGAAADHITGDQPQIKVPEASNSKDAQRRSERIEKGLQAAQKQADAVQTDNIRRTLVLNGLWSGMYACKGPIFQAEKWGVIPTQDKYEDRPESDYQTDLDKYLANKKLIWPIYRRAIDPRTLFPDPGTTGRKWVIQKYMRTVGDIMAQHDDWDGRIKGMSRSDKPMPETSEVDWLEYWDEHYRIYAAGGVIIDKVREHYYGRPPYQIRSAGYGIDTGKPEERFRSIIYPARTLINAQIAILNQIIAITRRTAWPMALQPTGAGLTEIAPGTIKDIPAEFIEKIRGFDMFSPQVLDGLLKVYETLGEQIEQATFPNVVKGIRAQGIASGYGQNSLVAEAKVKFGPAVVNLEAIESDYNLALAHCVQHVIEEPLPVWGETKWGKLDAVLDPDDLSDLRQVSVTINPKLPTDRANEVAIGQILLQLKAIDRSTFIQDYAGYPQPGEMMERIAADEAMENPAIKNVIALAAALENGYIKEVINYARELGMDPGALLQMVGFGQQQQGGGGPPVGQPSSVAPQIAAQRPAVPAQSMLGQPNKSQPGAPMTGSLTANIRQAQTPGTPSNIRNSVVPGLPIGG